MRALMLLFFLAAAMAAPHATAIVVKGDAPIEAAVVSVFEAIAGSQAIDADGMALAAGAVALIGVGAYAAHSYFSNRAAAAERAAAGKDGFEAVAAAETAESYGANSMSRTTLTRPSATSIDLDGLFDSASGVRKDEQ